jgi:hypothetical protein
MEEGVVIDIFFIDGSKYRNQAPGPGQYASLSNVRGTPSYRYNS